MIEIQASCDAAVLFENADWRVLDDGLEHRDTGYFIARDGLGRRSESGLWEWPLHLAEKRWCSPRLFREAFLAATDLFDLERDESLGRSFALGFGLRMGQGGVAGADDFTKLAELVRPRSVARRRPVGADPRAPSHHGPIGRPEEADAARAVRS